MTLKKSIKRVAIYIRVSTLDQAQHGYSLEAQERALRKWCKDKNYIIHGLYADKGISGKDIKHRPEMGRLLADAKNGQFDIVLFWALSRFTRSVADLYSVMGQFGEREIAMVSYTEAFDTSSPMGRAMIGIVGVFAQLERELTGERVQTAMAERAAQGKRTCSEILGYDKKGKDSFTINASEAEYVRFCFNEYLIRKSLSEVAKEAKARGYKGKRGKTPTAYSVEKILTRSVYCGYNTYCGQLYKGNYDPIISIGTFNRVNTILTRQGKSLGRQRINPIDKIK